MNEELFLKLNELTVSMAEIDDILLVVTTIIFGLAMLILLLRREKQGQ